MSHSPASAVSRCPWLTCLYCRPKSARGQGQLAARGGQRQTPARKKERAGPLLSIDLLALAMQELLACLLARQDIASAAAAAAVRARLSCRGSSCYRRCSSRRCFCLLSLIPLLPLRTSKRCSTKPPCFQQQHISRRPKPQRFPCPQ